MKKLFTLFIPLLIVFSLNGCSNEEEEITLIRPDFRKISYVDLYTKLKDLRPPTYEILIDGYWYDADENGSLTEKGKRHKQTGQGRRQRQGGQSRSLATSPDDSGGGGGC